LNHFRVFQQTRWTGATVRFGLVLTGEKLVDDIDYHDQLVALEEEAVGGEMEGAGLYVSSYDNKVDWIVVKAICDWGDGNKEVDKTPRQQLAARNAAEFVVQSLKNAQLRHPNGGSPHRP
jgi:nucleoside phosphorylase